MDDTGNSGALTQQDQTDALGRELEERLGQVRNRLTNLRQEMDDATTVEAGLEAAISVMHERRQAIKSQPMVGVESAARF